MRAGLVPIAIPRVLGGVRCSETAVFVANFSFESPAVSPGNFTTTAPDNWTVSSGVAGVLNPSSFELAPPTDGSQVGVVNNGSLPASLSQVLAAIFTVNTVYTLQVDLLARKGCCPWPGSELDLLAGNTVLASGTISSLSSGAVQTSTVTFLAASGNPLLGQALAIRMVNLDNTIGSEITFDNVRLDATVAPEPVSMALMGAGLLLLAAGKRRRRAAVPTCTVAPCTEISHLRSTL